MTPKEDLPEITLEVNVPVLAKPWRARAVKTKYGEKLMLVVKEGNVESEIKWLPIDLANDLVRLGVMELGKWDDGNIRYSVKKGAPEIAVCKRQRAGDPHPHYEVALPGEQDGPDMPAPRAPETPKASAAQAAVPDRGTPPDDDEMVGRAVLVTRALFAAFGLKVNEDTAPAAIECAQKLYVTFRIEVTR